MEIAKIQSLNSTMEQSRAKKGVMVEQAPDNKIEQGNKVGQDNKTNLNDLKGQDDFKRQEEQLLHAIEKSNGKIASQSNELSFAVHEATKQIMVKVIDKETKEVIREIPSEKVLDMVANMMETAGLFVDEKR